MNTMQIETSDGESFLFGTDGVSIDGGTSGVIVEDTVSVYYTGALNSSAGGSQIQSVSVTQISVTGWGGSYKTGSIVDATMNTIQLQFADNSTATFGIADALVTGGSGGLVVGGQATVYFTGTFDPSQEQQSNAQVVEVTVS